jgi:hypothetical protein
MAAARAATAALLDPGALAPAALPGGNPACCREPSPIDVAGAAEAGVDIEVEVEVARR